MVSLEAEFSLESQKSRIDNGGQIIVYLVLSMWGSYHEPADLGGRKGKILWQLQTSLGRTVRSVALVAQDRRQKPSRAGAGPAAGVIMVFVQASHPILEPVDGPWKAHGPAQNFKLRSLAARTSPIRTHARP